MGIKLRIQFFINSAYSNVGAWRAKDLVFGGYDECRREYNCFMPVLQFLTVMCSAVFAVAALYITLVEHPARLSAGVSVALLQFRPSYARASVLQVAMIVLTCLCSFGLWLFTRNWSWLIGGGLIGVSIPFTLIVVMPVNRLLLDGASPPTEAVALELLARWGRLHLIRTLTGMIGFATLLATSLNAI